MKSNEFINKVRELRRRLPEMTQRNAEIGAHDAVALIVLRIQEKGLDSDGEKLRDYTPKYKTRKERAGRYRGFVDLTYSGDMFGSVGIDAAKVTNKSGSKSHIKIGLTARDEANREKLEKNSALRGPVLAVRTSERNKVIRFFNERMSDEIKLILR